MTLPKCSFLSVAICASASTLACGAAGEDDSPGQEELAGSAIAAELTAGATYTLKGVHSGRCLDVQSGSTADGANVQLWDCNGATAQQFKFEAKGDGYFQVRNIASNKCLDVWGRSTADAAEISQYTCGGGDNQSFKVEDVRSGGVVRLIAKHSGKTLDAWGWGTANGTNIVQWPVTGGDNQLFFAAGSGSSGGGTSGSGTSGGGTTSAGCSSVGSTTTVNSTIVVTGTYDGGCKRFVAGSALGDGSQSESQKPVFRVENGATLRNVVIGAPAADGVHTYGTVTLENITWQDIGEDALTIKKEGTVTLNGGSATNGDDKVFQINAASTFRLSNFRASNAGKLIRQNGGTTYQVNVFIDRCDISNMDEAIFRTDSSISRVTMTNTRYSNIGDALFIGVSSGNISQSNNTEY
jgi:pectate lyase C